MMGDLETHPIRHGCRFVGTYLDLYYCNLSEFKEHILCSTPRKVELPEYVRRGRTQ